LGKPSAFDFNAPAERQGHSPIGQLEPKNQIRHKSNVLRLIFQVVGVRVMAQQNHHDEFEQAGRERSFDEEIGRQHLAVARDANEIARAASYAASDAAAAARFQARVSIAALIVAAIALAVSVMTPARIASYIDAQSWLLSILQRPNSPR
jgi:hypothetical protein